MPWKSFRLLLALRRTQRHPDWAVQLDPQNMTITTVNQSPKNTRIVKLRWFDNSWRSALSDLESRDLVIVDKFWYIKVKLSGWSYPIVTVKSAINFTVKDVLIPVIVAWLTALIVSD